MFDVCCYLRNCFYFEGTTRFAWYNTILKTKKCKIGGIDAERILDVIFFAQSKYTVSFFKEKKMEKFSIYFIFWTIIKPSKSYIPTNGNSEIDISSTIYSTIKTPFIISFHLYKKAILIMATFMSL